MADSDSDVPSPTVKTTLVFGAGILSFSKTSCAVESSTLSVKPFEPASEFAVRPVVNGDRLDRQFRSEIDFPPRIPHVLAGVRLPAGAYAPSVLPSIAWLGIAAKIGADSVGPSPGGRRCVHCYTLRPPPA